MPSHIDRTLADTIEESRVAISLAALLVKVTANTALGLTLSVASSHAMRVVKTRVFPLPAPANTKHDWAGYDTARNCSGLRLFNKDKAFCIVGVL